jgi:hypothetical protein
VILIGVFSLHRQVATLVGKARQRDGEIEAAFALDLRDRRADLVFA